MALDAILNIIEIGISDNSDSTIEIVLSISFDSNIDIDLSDISDRIK